MDMTYLVGSEEETVGRILADEKLANCGLGKRKVTTSLRSFGGDEFACSVFLKKYALRDEDDRILELTLDEAKRRWASEIASAEKPLADSSGKGSQVVRNSRYFYNLYEYFLPAGRQMYALGNRFIRGASYSNCYATELDDSLEGIMGAAYRISKTYAYGGGQGLCIGPLRPHNSKVSNSARMSTGAVSFMDLFSVVTGLIGQHHRRGAIMITIPVDHPDVELFVKAKSDEKNLKFANISIKLTDDFMRAVESDGEFVLRFDTQHEKIRRKVRARALWDSIVTVARNHAEPGIMFWDRMVEMSPSDTYDEMKLTCTNPCAELPLDAGSACVLGSLLLDRFVKDPFTDSASFDFQNFREMITRAVRHLDNVVELNLPRHPLQEQQKAAAKGRRIGLGITGLADCFAAMKIRYDSDSALEMAKRIMDFKMVAEYSASIDLAKERGSFPLFDPEKHYERGFCASLPEEIKERGKKHGQRNVTLSTVAPNGSLSIIAQCSSGIEPVFDLQYTRYCELGNKRQSFTVFHHGLARYMRSQEKKSDKLPGYWVKAHEIDYQFRIKLQGVLQKRIDSSISSTINLPRDASVDTVAEIYMKAWKEGLKGVTVYREGSREGILVTDEFAQMAGDPHMDTIVHRVRAEGGDKFYIPVSYMDRDMRKPYQVFVMNYKAAENDRFAQLARELKKMLVDSGVDSERIQKYSKRANSTLSRLTRFLSLSFKTGHLAECCNILDKHAYAGTLALELYKIFSRSLAVKNALCDECGGSNVRMEEGCMSCMDCGWSGCS